MLSLRVTLILIVALLVIGQLVPFPLSGRVAFYAMDAILGFVLGQHVSR